MLSYCLYVCYYYYFLCLVNISCHSPHLSVRSLQELVINMISRHFGRTPFFFCRLPFELCIWSLLIWRITHTSALYPGLLPRVYLSVYFCVWLVSLTYHNVISPDNFEFTDMLLYCICIVLYIRCITIIYMHVHI